MRLTTYTIDGPHEFWDDVAYWHVSGDRLHITLTKHSDAWGGAREGVIVLTPDVIGVADDAPIVGLTAAQQHAASYRPKPDKAARQPYRRGDAEDPYVPDDAVRHGLKIPGKEPVRDRFAPKSKRK